MPRKATTNKHIDRLIGQRVRFFRIERQLSQHELASKLGISYQQLHKYETGANSISISRLYQIAEALQIRAPKIFEGLEAAAGEKDAPNLLDREQMLLLHYLGRITDPEHRRTIIELIDSLSSDLRPKIGAQQALVCKAAIPHNDGMAKFRYIDDLVQRSTTPCAIKGCNEPGEYRAPVSPTALNEYQWLCLEHIKRFNKQWDFFKEKSSDEILAFQKDAFTGHRPTWKMHPDGRCATEKLHDAFARFRGESQSAKAPPVSVHLPPAVRRALKQLQLVHPVSAQEIKQRYKDLVKRYHPDRNPGDKKAEETFKQITIAYRVLIDEYSRAISEG